MQGNDVPQPLASGQIARPSEPQPTELPAGRVPPSVGLYQPTFPLTEADFLRLQKSSPALSAIGGTVLAFGLSYGLPGLLTTWRIKPDERNWLDDDLMIAGTFVLLGLLFLGLGVLFSRERFQLMKRIRTHFTLNPGQHEFRGVQQ